ncbi:MAG: YjbQ family protein [Candidatus Omnitrophica bacterium]|nr:YjbQ family protein [Candidatus Omnitrophota bacterium]
MQTISVNTSKRCEFVDITREVNLLIKKSGQMSGTCVVFCPHTTAGLTINENADPAVKADIISHLAKLVPSSESFTHTEGNSDAHIKGSFLGSCLNIIIDEGQLVLGTWQAIYFCEFDGPRKRQVHIKIASD